MTSHTNEQPQTDIDPQYERDCEHCRVEIAKVVGVLLMQQNFPAPAVASGLANCLGSLVATVQPKSTRAEFLDSTIECVREAVDGTLDAWKAKLS